MGQKAHKSLLRLICIAVDSQYHGGLTNHPLQERCNVPRSLLTTLDRHPDQPTRRPRSLQPVQPRPRPRQGFTLIELLVFISIIALLIGILLPALGAATKSAKATKSLSNLKQIGLGLSYYTNDNDGFFPMHSSSSSGPWPGYSNRPRWADYIFQYMQVEAVYRSPLLTEREINDLSKPFSHDTSKKHGGYGYNFQYLGNSRFTPTFHANAGSDIGAPSQTVAVADTAGSRDGSMANEPGAGGSAAYVIDPPLGSARGSAKGSYYEGGSDAGMDAWRSFPAERNNGNVNAAFADGHAEAMKLSVLDDMDGDGTLDNGYWNGRGNPDLK